MKKLLCFGVVCLLFLGNCRQTAEPSGFTLTTFQADVTPPVGHMLLTGKFQTATGIHTRLEARGLVLQIPNDQAVVICAVDWAEIRNETYDQWRDRLAEAAGTSRERVFLSSIHQHDTPMGDLGAERALRSLGSPFHVIDPKFHERALQGVVEAVRKSLSHARPVTHIGVGSGKVKKIASNRRYLSADGTPKFDRGSACHIPEAQHAPEGAIDPFLKTLSFWNGDEELAAYSVYATHPMSYYGTRQVDSDFPGLARARRQKDTPGTLQIYATGCSGNVTAGKYNDGNPANREVLADRLYKGMLLASRNTTKVRLKSASFRNERLTIQPRRTEGFTRPDLLRKIRESSDARDHLLASLGLSWLDRIEKEGSTIDVPSLEFNHNEAQIVLLPGEIYVNYQIYAQGLAPTRFIMTPAYGESAPGYIPLERHWAEHDHNLDVWCWVSQGMERPIEAVLKKLISDSSGEGGK